MTDDEVMQAAARADAATAGPWRAERVSVNDLHWGPMPSNVLYRGPDANSYVAEDIKLLADWEFIAHARTDVPALAAEVLRLRAIVAALVEAGE